MKRHSHKALVFVVDFARAFDGQQRSGVHSSNTNSFQLNVTHSCSYKPVSFPHWDFFPPVSAAFGQLVNSSFSTPFISPFYSITFGNAKIVSFYYAKQLSPSLCPLCCSEPFFLIQVHQGTLQITSVFLVTRSGCLVLIFLLSCVQTEVRPLVEVGSWAHSGSERGLRKGVCQGASAGRAVLWEDRELSQRRDLWISL